jgi:small-conductance mechanosensitive channel
MDPMVEIGPFEEWFQIIYAWVDARVFNLPNLLQVTAIIAVYFGAHLLADRVREAWSKKEGTSGFLVSAGEWLSSMALPALWLILQSGLYILFSLISLESTVLRLSLSLAAAWLAINLLVTPIKNRFMARTLASFIWLITALSILGLFEDARDLLEAASISLGDDKELTALGFISGIAVLVMFIWFAIILTGVIERQVAKIPTLPISARVLITKVSRIVLIIVAAIGGLSAAGLDLTVFAVVGGAIGLGIGFGLQKVISNLFSGFILLIDRSIKPGDVIEIQGTYGSINRLAARYTSIITRDGTEFLIPNEDMITQPVINWSHTNQLVRMHVGIGISYASDVYRARELMIEAAQVTDRVLETPSAVCHLVEFGDNSLNLDLRFWIRDPQNGIVNVSSAVRLEVWDRFNEAGITVPFPQRDVHIIADKGENIGVIEKPVTES